MLDGEASAALLVTKQGRQGQSSTVWRIWSRLQTAMALASHLQTHEGFLRSKQMTWGRWRTTGAPHTLAPPYPCPCNRTWGRHPGRHTRLGRSPGQSTL